MSGSERRQSPGNKKSPEQLREGLTPQQLATLKMSEQFGWTLEFVRRPMFMAPMPVMFDRERTRFVLLEADGTINENPGFTLRD